MTVSNASYLVLQSSGDLPMTMNRIVSTTKPMSWIGFRPHLSMRKNVAQYPGTEPATDKMIFPTARFHSVPYTTCGGG